MQKISLQGETRRRGNFGSFREKFCGAVLLFYQGVFEISGCRSVVFVVQDVVKCMDKLHSGIGRGSTQTDASLLNFVRRAGRGLLAKENQLLDMIFSRRLQQLAIGHRLSGVRSMRWEVSAMKLLQSTSVGLVVLVFCTVLLAFQRTADLGFGNDSPQSNEKAEFSWSRLSYTSAFRSFGGGYGGYGYGYGRGSWSRDYPKADRQFLIALKRLTRIQGRSTEQVVNLDSNDIFNYPWIYAVQVQTWSFTDDEAKRLREYLLKGGFLMVDDFHGTADWENFMHGMRQVFPDRPVEDLDNKDEIFHVLYDLDDRFQVPGEQYISTGRTYEKDGYVPKWRAIRDDKGRIMVAICFNMHLGDAWEWADDPEYPETFASMAFREGLNYIVYGMTH